MTPELTVRCFNISAPHRDIPCKELFHENAHTNAVIIGIHGFGGDKESLALTLLAEKMPASWRLIALDFPCHGASDDTPLTVEGCINDLLSAVKYAENNFPNARIYTFGTSFGGYISLLTEEALRGRVSKMVLRAPAVEMDKTLIEKLLDISPESLKNSGSACVFTKKLRVDYAFYEELISRDIFALSPKTPALMICATKDELVDYSAQVRFAALNPQIKRADIVGAGHRFMGNGELEAAINHAIDYLTTEKEV